ncbi:hypothetical protein BEWA_017000 [Theileria equi strain WA]|uniref:Signal peptide-containing protein n=1 Tax=Theileria equi strain WA TaxID=1537102 RepID=L1L937_THEEQ|nr:hypothetical protein BEWA_017000 [Theileria equi strain WA]EKX72021.1 hypothetical protein BEWA_017000 [Theileria equi strain WA]|eukprot:XP_004831473.1 hypothetical protein BEWA_017000 [Theileria equi strain WA]
MNLSILCILLWQRVCSHHNTFPDLIPIDLDVRSYMHAPQIAVTRVDSEYKTCLFDIEEEHQSKYKIGNVWDGVFKVYDDSDIILTRNIFYIFIPFIRSYIQINSRYLHSSGKITMETVEFVKHATEEHYVELIREPVTFDLAQLPLAPLVIILKEINGYKEFVVDEFFKMDMFIGAVINGHAVIDNRVHGVIYKIVRLEIISPEKHKVTVKTLTKHGVEYLDEFESTRCGNAFNYLQTLHEESSTF